MEGGLVRMRAVVPGDGGEVVAPGAVNGPAVGAWAASTCRCHLVVGCKGGWHQQVLQVGQIRGLAQGPAVALQVGGQVGRQLVS